MKPCNQQGFLDSRRKDEGNNVALSIGEWLNSLLEVMSYLNYDYHFSIIVNEKRVVSSYLTTLNREFGWFLVLKRD